MSTPINSMIDKVVKPIPKPDNIIDGEVYATHEGILNIGGIDLKVYITCDGKRLIDAESIDRFFAEITN